MKNFFFNVRFQLLRFLGVHGLLGVLLLMSAVLTGHLLAPLASTQNAVLKQALQTARDSAARASDQRRSVPNSAAQLQNLWDWLPPLASNAMDIQKLFDLAKQGGVVLGKADYQITIEPSAQFVRYQVTLPIKEHYLTVRRFAADALNTLPHLALDELQFSRIQASTDLVDAQLRLTFFYKPQ
jgi:hypothetical protein